MDEQDFEVSGMAQDIFNIYHKSSDKQSVKEMFFEFTGMEFDQYLMKCSREITTEIRFLIYRGTKKEVAKSCLFLLQKYNTITI